MKTMRGRQIKSGDIVAWEGTKVKVRGAVQICDEVAVIGDWVDGFTVSGDVMRFFIGSDDQIEAEGDWTREELDEVINRRFPHRLMVFYTPDSNYIAAVEDGDGNMYRVWADDDTEFYKR